MIQGTEARLDGTTLVVRIPMRFQRRGGRKRIVAPDGSTIAPSSKPQPEIETTFEAARLFLFLLSRFSAS